MRILHTSDWHLGRSLHSHRRYGEFEAFLDWLISTIEQEKVDALLVAGDIFDTGTPSNRAQSLYYKFLGRVSSTHCQHIVITAGNHDSPTFLNAPKELLKELNVHVVGAITDNLEDEVIVLNSNNEPQAIICAVPYLRDRDVRTAEPGETIEDKNAKLIEGISNHYAEVYHIAEQKRAEFKNPNLPIIAMGHLYTAGGVITKDDGVRNLYVGSLAYVDVEKFPHSIDYYALGHLHVPQLVNEQEHIRYSGSPIAIGFGEAGQEKKVIIVEFSGTNPSIEELTVPTFQELVRIEGTVEQIEAEIAELKEAESQAWLEIEYTGNDIVPNLSEIVDNAVAETTLNVVLVKNKQISDRVAMTFEDNETLADLTVEEVFRRRLDAEGVSESDRVELTAAYNEIVKDMMEEDSNA